MDLHLDRLTLRLSGISEAQAKQLADLVGQHLAAATPPDAACDTDAMRISVPARTGEDLESLAHRIVSEMLRSLARSVS